MNIGVILAGGIGSRFGGTKPKQYYLLQNKEIISYAITAFSKAQSLDHFIVVVDQQEYESGTIATKYSVTTVLGGSNRNQSLNNAITAISKLFPDCRNIFIHEAARPFIKPETIDYYISLLDEYNAVVTTLNITDSLGRTDNNQFVNRDHYCLIQAPEAYQFDLLRQYSNDDGLITATLQKIKEPIKIFRNYHLSQNMKITYLDDLLIAEAIMKGSNND